METNIDGQSTWSRLVAQWQPAVLLTVCVAGGLTLTTMVIGSTPDVVVQASQAALEAAPVDVPDAPVASEVPVDTALSTDSTEVVDPASAEAAVAAPGTASAAPLEPATAAPGPAPAGPAPTAAPSVGSPSAPAPAPVVTAAPVTPGRVAAPQATAAPTTAAPPAIVTPAPAPAAQPAPTTAAPPPTTAAPVTAALTYPSFSAGSAATVVLQFDGSSIYVASVNRQANWVSQVDKNGPSTVEIKFFNTVTQQDEEFHATVENGRIKVEN